jgi:hypothetical protein
MSEYENMIPLANKVLNQNGSISTFDGTELTGPNDSLAHLWESYAPLANKILMPDGSITTLAVAIPGGGGGGEGTVSWDAISGDPLNSVALSELLDTYATIDQMNAILPIAVTTGTGANLIATIPNFTPVKGSAFVMLPHANVTANATLNVNGMGASIIGVHYSNASTIGNLITYQLQASSAVVMVYNGTRWVMESGCIVPESVLAPRTGTLSGTAANFSNVDVIRGAVSGDTTITVSGVAAGSRTKTLVLTGLSSATITIAGVDWGVQGAPVAATGTMVITLLFDGANIQARWA